MVKLYVDLILQNKWTLERVPYLWKEQVKREIEAIREGE